MSLPNGPEGLAAGIEFGVTGNDGSITGLVGRTQAAVVETLKHNVLQSPGWNGATAALWAGLRRGLPGTPVSLLHGLAESLVHRLYGVGTEFGSLENTLESAARVLTNGMHLGNIHLSSVVAHPTEALHNPGFDSLSAISLSPPWEWDATVGYSRLGSAKVVADGRPKTLVSNTVTATPGQQCPMKIHVRYTGVTAAAASDAIRLSVGLFDANRHWLDTQLVAAVASPAGDSMGWVELAGICTVPSGVSFIATRLDVTADATAGTVWFTAASLKQQGNPSWLQEVIDAAQGTRDTIVNRLRGGVATIGNDLAALTAALDAIPAANVQGLLALVDDHHALRDGIVNALGIHGTGFTPNAVRSSLQEFLQRLPASSIIGEINSTLASIAINGVTGLTGYLTNLTTAGLYDASQGFHNLSTSLLRFLDAGTGQFDASQLGNIINIPVIAQSRITNLVNTVQKLNSSTGLYDASAGFVNQATSILKNLNASGLFDASQLTNIASIPAIAISSITNLSGTVQKLSSSTGLYDASAGFANQATSLLKKLDAGTGLYDASAGFVNQATSILKNLNASGLFDAAQLTNITNIPAIAQANITNLVNTVQKLNSTTGLYDASAGFVNAATSLLRYLDSATGLYDASQGFKNQATSILKNLNASGLFDAAQLTNIGNIPAIAIGSVTSLANTVQKLNSSTGLYDASAGFVNQATSILKNLNASGLFDAAQLTNITNIPVIAQSRITNLVNTVQKLNSSTGLYDASAGFVNQATSILKNINASGLFDAAQLTNIANIPTIAQSSITGLINTVQKLNSTTGLYDASAGFANQATSLLKYISASTGLYDASQGFTNASTSLLKYLTASGGNLGQFDASQLGNIINIPVIAQSRITNLVNTVQKLNSSTGLYDASAGFVNQATSILKNLNASGLFDASQLTNIASIPAIAISSVTNLANTVQKLNSSTGLYDASAGFVNQATSILKNLNASGLFDAAQLTNIVNIPAIAISSVTSLATTVQKLNSSTGLYDASAGFVNQATSILKNLNASGLFDASQLTNIASIPAIAQTNITNLVNTVQKLNSATGVYDASAGFANQATSILKNLNGSGLFDAAQLTNITNIPAIAAAKISGALTGATIDGTAVTSITSIEQSIVNGIHDAVNDTITTIAQDASTVQANIGNLITGLVNNWTGQNKSSVSATDVSAAAQNSTISVATNTQAIASIQATLPSFYGVPGGGGMSKSAIFSGTLPGDFTTVSTVAGASAKYNTPADSDTQTVSGSWTVSDGYAKYLLLRADLTFSSYVYLKLQDNAPFTNTANCGVYCVVSGGAPTQIGSSFTLPGSGTIIAGPVYSLSAVGWTFTVSGPGGLNVSVTDTSHISKIGVVGGTTYRYGGFGTDGWARQSDLYNTAGTATYTVPGWVAAGSKFDFAAVGAGGGGGYGGAFQVGGKAGLWNTARLVYGTDTSASTFSVTVGTPGAGADVNPGNNATSGTASSITASGYGTLTAAGGAAMSNTSVNGQSPANYTFNNIGYRGGATDSTYYTNGKAPGGGGIGLTGGNGAPGGAWITAIDTSVPGSLGAWAFYDSATAGPATAYVATSESTTSTTYTDLTTTTDTITVNIGPNACALVLLNVKIMQDTVGAFGYMSFALSGANSQAADDSFSTALLRASSGGTSIQGGSFLLTGLAAGSTTFKAKYRVSGGGTGTFALRRIAVIPL